MSKISMLVFRRSFMAVGLEAGVENTVLFVRQGIFQSQVAAISAEPVTISCQAVTRIL